MRFFKKFKAQDKPHALGYVLVFEIFGFRQNLTKSKKFQKPACSQEPEVYPGLWNFWKISFLAWVMNNTVWSQIVVLFDRFSHHYVFFLVFTVFTSNMNFFDHSNSNHPSFCLAGFSPGGPSFEPSFERSFPKLRSLWTKLWTKFWTDKKN